MANVNENYLVRGARGNFAKQFVYRKHGENTNIARMPKINKDAEPTEKQTQVRELFAEATNYARGVMSSEDLKKEYEKKATPGKTAYNLACRDYLKAPKVKEIDLSKYKGPAGSVLIIKAKDDFRVTEVSVSIRSATGELLEEGNGLLDAINRNKWNYTTVKDNVVLAGSVIKATAHDLPGNTGSLDITVPGVPVIP